MFRFFIGITVTVALALLLGWTGNCKPVARVTAWIGAIAVLLIIRWCL